MQFDYHKNVLVWLVGNWFITYMQIRQYDIQISNTS